jgi:NAD(P)-dependent dehydrogenase (short-subunit alcohol dehydrogenase family)
VDAAASLGGLDVLVNNASLLGPSPQPALLDYPLEVLEIVYRVNVFAPLALIQSLKLQLKPGAVVINVSSDAGVETYPGWGGYGSSKAALEQLSAILAAENPQWRLLLTQAICTQMLGGVRRRYHDQPLPEASVPGTDACFTVCYRWTLAPN